MGGYRPLLTGTPWTGVAKGPSEQLWLKLPRERIDMCQPAGPNAKRMRRTGQSFVEPVLWLYLNGQERVRS